ncbi:MAG: VWA domain-containing protein [Myxococcales bacterium]|nr:VWA domain-containing protein [Myxococcales bacterium]
MTTWGRGAVLGLGTVLLWLTALLGRAWAAGPPGVDLPPLVPTDGSDRFRAYTDPGELPRLRLADGAAELPLRHTRVRARITGLVAQVEVTQTYDNPYPEPIEAVYVFPLPENSAVDDMRMVIGDREVVAEIQRRERARRTYEQARRAGHTAALLEQERTNVFTQSVANLAPGEPIDVVIRYVQDLSYDAGSYEYVFPMVVGPRYVDGAPRGGRPSGTGTKADTDRVPDASRVSPPVAGPGTRTGHDISIELRVDAGLPIRGFDVPTHAVTGGLEPDGTLALTLAEGATIPNRDFVLRYRVAGPAVRPVLLLDGDDQGGCFNLVVQPPDVDVDGLVGARELLFVVDVSGSMSGVPLAIGKAAMREAIRRLRPVDTFNIVTFAGHTGLAFDQPRPANDQWIREALAFVDGLRAGGSTEILDAVDVALSTAPGRGRHRYVFFLTDGYVAIEDEVYARTRRWIEVLAKRGQRARVFSLGVGSSPDRELLASLAKAGDGLELVLTTREEPREAVDRFYGAIDLPIWTDLEIDWGGMVVTSLHPSSPPDLFATRPAVLHGCYEGPPAAELRLRARDGARQVQAIAPARRSTVAPGVVTTLWARARVEELRRTLSIEGDRGQVDEITQLGLDHRLVTPYTSFVAVDRTRVVGKGDPARVVQPVEVPEGVDAELAGAEVARRSMEMRALASESAVYDFDDDSIDGEHAYDAPALGSRRSEREEPRTELERADAKGGGCAHRRGRDLAELGLPLLLLGLRRRRGGRRWLSRSRGPRRRSSTRPGARASRWRCPRTAPEHRPSRTPR